MTADEILVEINVSIRRLIEVGLSVQQNWPILKTFPGNRKEIAIAGSPELTISMKDEPYWEVYEQLLEARAFHVQMIDGTLIQMLYRFEGKKLISHRLCTFPAPNLDPYDNEPKSYEEDEIYADIIAKNIVHVPMRFDYNPDDHKEVDHPMSHLTLGQYVNCRIPVSAPVTPARFLRFLLRNFYFTAFHTNSLGMLGGNKSFEETITRLERTISHLVC